MVDQSVPAATVSTHRSRPRLPIAAMAEPTRWIQTLGFFMVQAGATVEILAAQSGVARLRVTKVLRGELSITGEEALALASVLRCEPQELMNGARGTRVSGGAICSTHGMDGRSLPNVRPLSEPQWRAAWAELGIENGIIPAKTD